ncbi:hypothetical protein N7537_012033 [Penicillium hordei]|uniref:Uncharacterized protein n=1 Tax=Penicillium hordei TaxID=40994 RepID=A0AAD6DMY4_9EURO|nr:uncharacterized protein N7537_012033 [Penicillium hordei]KAJ5589355.1 hypothetical protein N7537_012033 [Penicillium hordei]
MVRRSTSYLCEHNNQNSRELWMTQVILLNQLASRYSGVPGGGGGGGLEIEELLQALPVTLARRKRLFTSYLPQERVSHLDLPLYQRWQIRALDEERRRTGFAIWTLFRLVSDAGWTAILSKTGVPGKSAILQQLLSTIEENRRQSLYCSPNVSVIDCTAAANAPRQILAITYHQKQDLPMNELKALGTHRIIIFSVLIMNNSPNMPLLSTGLKFKYKRYSDCDLGRLQLEWSSSPRRTRQAVVYAADLFDTVRSTYCTHYSTSVLFFQSALVLWLYSVLLGQSQDTPPDTPSVIIGASDFNNSKEGQWVETGRGRIKMSGVGNLSSPSGLGKLSDESISTMRNIKWWGISKIYEQLLV